ncbi:MAG: prepilin-type N-terminal cleavage/methylation domain-containing protein [Proteobacteria bacterium]|nr:prepilin-type N-terminal cleavage/methylation domain-containing protein [Pseudomonadota bacterium]
MAIFLTKSHKYLPFGSAAQGGAAYGRKAIAAGGDEAVRRKPDAIPPSKWHRLGMTMIEVMISVALLSGVMAIGWGSYSVATSHQQRMQDINERLHAVEQAVNRIVRDMSTAFITKHGDDESQTEIRYQTGFLGESERVDFTSMGYVRMFRDEKVGDQSEISYFIKDMRDDDGNLSTYLVRREQAPINDDYQKGGTILPLLDHVLSFRLEYWDDEKADIAVGSDGWVDSWDTENSEYEGRLPSRVKIEIEIEDPLGSDTPMLISTQAQIHLTKALDF